MKRFLQILGFVLIVAGVLFAVRAAADTPEKQGGFTMKWERTLMDQSRTGTSMATADNVAEALGTIDGTDYVAPNGKRFLGNTVTAKVAGALIAAQGPMARVKEVIGFAPEGMVREAPECALYDLYIDQLMASVEKSSGKKVDFALANRGGVRIDLPKGDILLDDILSMFPFKNYTVYLQLTGKDIRRVLEQCAATPGFQIIGGARVRIKDGKLVSAEIGGKPLNDKQLYGVATISFLLNGGDNIFMARNAKAIEMYEVKMSDFMVDYFREQKAAGLPIVYKADGRVTVEE